VQYHNSSVTHKADTFPLRYNDERMSPILRRLVFVFRSDPQPVDLRVPVLVNLVRLGELTNGTFVVATVNPGKTFLRIGDQVVATYTIEVAANRSYFVRLQAVPGMKPVRTEVRMVNETEGRLALAQSRLLGTVPPAVAAAPRAQPPAAPAAAPERPKPAPPVAAAPPSQAAKPAAKPAEPEGDWEVALIVNAGTFKLANASQKVATLNGTYTTASSPVFGLEAEWRSKAGFAAGGEFFSYKNDLVTSSGTVGAALSTQQVYAVLANGKYYFHAMDWFYPFVGAGIGVASATYSGGNLKGNSGGLAYQGLAGVDFRFGSFGAHLQYKYLAATTGKSEKVKMGGAGILAGVSFIF
jgi:opacity protein-like surface antigen